MTPWDRAQTALALLAIDPIGLGGIVARGRIGPARNAFVRLADALSPNLVKLHPGMSAQSLDGGIDLAATLAAGRLMQHSGILARQQSRFILGMAERTDPFLAARLGMALDAGAMNGLIALDEGADTDEGPPAALSDRLAFHIALDEITAADLTETALMTPGPLGQVKTPKDLPEQLIMLCAQLGIYSLRAPTFTLRAVRAHAALNGRAMANQDDIIAAVALVLAPRATQIPDQADAPSPTQPENSAPPQDAGEQQTIPDDMLLDAVLAALPEGLLDQMKTTRTKGATGSGTGKTAPSNRQGRPLPARNARAKSGDRVDLVATLRAAVPWQNIRRRANPHRRGAIITPNDLRAKRYQFHSDRVLIFTVDASGSAAIARLAEAKGAIELLLAEAYSRRDHVALVAFRGAQAEVLLPPTRSLVQTKRRLASLPGGGGTPLASGLLSALSVAQSARKRGQTPSIIVLTDGRSNIALDGTANRGRAQEDAQTLGKRIAVAGFDTLMIDTGQRPEHSLRALAQTMGAPYTPLPRACAKQLSQTVNDSLRG